MSTAPSRRRSPARKIVLVLVSTVAGIVIALLGAEGWLRIQDRGGDPPPPFEESSARIHVTATTPGLVFELGKNRTAVFRGVDVHTNSLGLRDDEPRTPRAGRLVAAIGDSLTFGWGIEVGDTWPQMLERDLSAEAPCEVDNFGVSGYSTRDELEVFRHKLPSGVRCVVLGYFLNDPEPRVVSPIHQYFQDRTWWHRSLLFERWRRGRLRDELRSHGGSLYRWVHDPSGPAWRDWLHVVDDFAAQSRAAKVPVLVALFPTFHGFTSFASYPFADLHHQVQAAFEARGFQVLDLVPAFARDGAAVTDVRVDDEHPNASGNRIAAGAIAGRLRQLGWLDGDAR